MLYKECVRMVGIGVASFQLAALLVNIYYNIHILNIQISCIGISCSNNCYRLELVQKSGPHRTNFLSCEEVVQLAFGVIMS